MPDRLQTLISPPTMFLGTHSLQMTHYAVWANDYLKQKHIEMLFVAE